MYATCLFCHGDLGRNERLPRFPVGKRLAFDAAKGRLWVICRRCAQWNLTPLEERWETVEECERIFRGTRVRVSTDQIGLVELPEGLSLVRIGRPLRPEFAAWRYGRRFAWRRIRNGVAVGLGAAGVAGLAIGSVAGGVAPLTILAGYAAAAWFADGGPKRRVSRRMRACGELVRVRLEDAESSRVFVDGGDDAYGLALQEDGERRALEGELAELERAWREAEEIAAIADDLFLPAHVTDRLRVARPD